MAIAFDELAAAEGCCPACGVSQPDDPEEALLVREEAERAAGLLHTLLLSTDRLRRLGVQVEPRRPLRQALARLVAGERVRYEHGLVSEQLDSALVAIKAWGRYCRADRRAQGAALSRRLRGLGAQLRSYALLAAEARSTDVRTEEIEAAVAAIERAADVIRADNPIAGEQALNAVMSARQAVRAADLSVQDPTPDRQAAVLPAPALTG